MRAAFNIITDRVVIDPEGVRLTDEQYKAVKSANFAWWPGRKWFVAKWSPAAEDLALQLAGDIAEDDTPDDVEARVERFERYAAESEKSAAAAAAYSLDAATAHRRELAAHRAQTEAERALYWQNRIEGAIARAQYREQPGVIARRINGLEADARRYAKEMTAPECLQAAMSGAAVRLGDEYQTSDPALDPPELIVRRSRYTMTVNGKAGEESILVSAYDKDKLKAGIESHKAHYARWLAHVTDRLAYERALLAAAGGLPTDGQAFEVGGAVMVDRREDWREILKVNKTTLALKSRSRFEDAIGIKWQKTTVRGMMSKAQYESYLKGEYNPNQEAEAVAEAASEGPERYPTLAE